MKHNRRLKFLKPNASRLREETAFSCGLCRTCRDGTNRVRGHAGHMPTRAALFRCYNYPMVKKKKTGRAAFLERILGAP